VGRGFGIFPVEKFHGTLFLPFSERKTPDKTALRFYHGKDAAAPEPSGDGYYQQR
jgi:hypothetical protein